MDDRARRRLAFTNSLLFETPGGLRFTQDSPILPNVWLAFAENPHEQQELILTSVQDGGTGQAAAKIREMLRNYREKRKTIYPGVDRERARVSYIPGQMAVRLYFDELMRVVLPLTPWWHETYNKLRRLEHTASAAAGVADWQGFPQPSPGREQDLYDALLLMRREIQGDEVNGGSDVHPDRMAYIRDIPADLTWFVRITGLLANCLQNQHNLLDKKDTVSWAFEDDFAYRREGREISDVGEDPSEEGTEQNGLRPADVEDPLTARRSVARAFTELYRNWSTAKHYPKERLIWRITKNRPIKLAVNNSSLTVKADAAIRLFDISCEKITWAVVDSGIDPNHDAFKDLSVKAEKDRRGELKRNENRVNDLRLEDMKATRIVKTLDFTRLRELLDYDIDMVEPERIEDHKKVVEEIARRMKRDDGEDCEEKARELLIDLKNRIKKGKDINWQDLEAAIVDENPAVPENDHGTHVAGILAADWIDDLEHEKELPLKVRTRRMQGVCPDINLIDVRVFRDDGLTDEFELLAAMQFLRWMNERAGTMKVHGANLSLSLIHEVRRFACGRTPICDECNESVAAGMAVVVAAGNRGFEMDNPEDVGFSDSYRSVSITDPGNAHSVITVGATHRKRPHEYGVSYFSSRGPTGDGRLKPDIVAPGEKIKGPTPNNRAEFKDGTSMAAPHVSGAAALLMARHTELIANPERIKRILCDTATDLERERYFQGHGLVDILRALQSV